MWRRNSQGERVTIPVHHRRGQELTVKCGYPQEGNCRFAWNKESGELTVELPERISARLFELTELSAEDSQKNQG